MASELTRACVRLIAGIGGVRVSGGVCVLCIGRGALINIGVCCHVVRSCVFRVVAGNAAMAAASVFKRCFEWWRLCSDQTTTRAATTRRSHDR